MIELLLVFPPLVWLMLSAFFYAQGEYFSKLWAINPNVRLSILVLLSYSIAALTWLPALLHKSQITIMGATWLLLATVATVVIGCFIFNEDLTDLQLVGLGLACTAMMLLSS